MKKPILWLTTVLAIVIPPVPVFAHCDSLDGPVVKAAQRALDTRQVAFVLPWVRVQDEIEVEAAFASALEVRALSAEAQALADRYFFETVVRIHRTGTEFIEYVDRSP
jgi:hypothetical protein